jgi:hypothetical protein
VLILETEIEKEEEFQLFGRMEEWKIGQVFFCASIMKRLESSNTICLYVISFVAV